MTPELRAAAILQRLKDASTSIDQEVRLMKLVVRKAAAINDHGDNIQDILAYLTRYEDHIKVLQRRIHLKTGSPENDRG